MHSPEPVEPAAPGSPRVESLRRPEVYEQLASSRTGLTADAAARRLAEVGPNVIAAARKRPLTLRLLSNFTHVMAMLLWIGGVIAILAGLPELGVAVWLVNVINGLFSFWQEYRAEKATEALPRLLPAYATVLRDGREAQVVADELVPGDVMVLSEGDRVSADGRLVEQFELRMDQSTLTGESDAVRKGAEPVDTTVGNRAELPNLVFAGTTVASGRGKAVVFATGMRTEFGKIAHLTQELEGEPSPLQKELTSLSYLVSVVAVGVGTLFFLLAWFMTGMSLGRAGVFGLGMIVAFVPEGLLPTVTLSLAMATQRMADRHALVKKLSAVETLGSTSVICTDKTGTLTENEMTVREVFVPGAAFELSGGGYDPDGAVTLDGAAPVAGKAESLRRALLSAGLANNARLVAPTEDRPRWTVIGDPTEAALRVACAKAGIDLEREAGETPRVYEIPFDSRRKRMSTVHAGPDGEVVHVKGAPRELLDLCTAALVDGERVPLDGDLRAQVESANDAMSRRGLRVLATAFRALDPATRERAPEQLERDLVFLGLAGMLDPPRAEVYAAVEDCHRAGIRIVMITGDYGLTAESVGRRVGLVGGDVTIVNGDQVEAMSDADLESLLAADRGVLFARSAPEHKLRVVRALQRLGNVVAVTGDGVNDAPALKQADIGVAMGVVGTDVAREAADVILLDDNFASIVHAVEEGRAVYANIKKFTSYIFTSNAPEAVPFILYAFSAGSIPLALDVMHILSIDLGTDLVPALALGAEPPEPGVMDRPPRTRDEHIVSRSMLIRAYLWLGPLQGACVMAAFYLEYWMNGYYGRWTGLPADTPLHRRAMAMALAAVVFTQIGNLFAQRSSRISVRRLGLFTNRLLWIGIASELAVIALIVYTPFLQDVIGVAPFAAVNWLWLVPAIPVLLVADEVRKALIPSWENRRRRSA